MTLTKKQLRLLNDAKEAAVELGEAGKALTSIIGELSACQVLGLRWIPSDGFDASSRDGVAYQIKSRRPGRRPKLTGSARIGVFHRKAGYNFDFGTFVSLNPLWEAIEMWKLPKKSIIEIEGRKSEASGIHVRTLRREGILVWSKS